MRWTGFAFACCMALLTLHVVASAKQFPKFEEAKATPNPYVGMTLAEIRALPDFIPIEQRRSVPLYVPSSARESAKCDAPFAFHWIGYIELPAQDSSYPQYIVFDDTGAGVTYVKDRHNPFDDDFVPAWFVGTLDYLFEVGYFEGYP